MQDWQYVKLGEVCAKDSSNIAQKDLENSNGEYPIYGASGFIKNIDFYQQEKEYIAVVKDGAGVGRAMLLPAKSSVIGTMQYIIPNEEISTKYLYYAIENMNLAKYYSGATIPHIYFRDYQKETFRLPKRKEQEKISAVFEKIEQMVDYRKQQLQKLDELVKARFVEMFGDVIHNPVLPMIELKNIADIGSSKRIYASEYTESGIPFYRSKEIRELGLGEKPSAELYITEERYEEIKKKFGIPKLGDILVAAIGATIGYSWVVDTEEPFYYKDGNIINISMKSEVNCVFLNYVLQVLIADYKTKGAAGSAQLALTIEKLEKMKVVYPEMNLQKGFADFVQQINKSKLEVQKSLERLETLKKALMQKYFG